VPYSENSSYDTQRGLPEDIDSEASQAFDHANDLIDENRFVEGIEVCLAAIHLLPTPASYWWIHTRLQVALGDAYFLSGDLAMAEKHFHLALRSHEGLKTTFVHLQLCHCAYKRGDKAKAVFHLQWAFRQGGQGVFEQMGTEYWELVKDCPRGLPLTVTEHPPPPVDFQAVADLPAELRAFYCEAWQEVTAHYAQGDLRSAEEWLTKLASTPQSCEVSLPSMQRMYAALADVRLRKDDLPGASKLCHYFSIHNRSGYLLPLSAAKAWYELDEPVWCANSLALALVSGGFRILNGEDERLTILTKALLPEPECGWSDWEGGMYPGMASLVAALNDAPQPSV
jgi:tetratricopeptide (TPR) repeat protein